jgi:hypothetical protein
MRRFAASWSWVDAGISSRRIERRGLRQESLGVGVKITNAWCTRDGERFEVRCRCRATFAFTVDGTTVKCPHCGRTASVTLVHNRYRLRSDRLVTLRGAGNRVQTRPMT